MINGSAARKLAQTATTAGARYVGACSFFCWNEDDDGYNLRARASNAKRYRPPIAHRGRQLLVGGVELHRRRSGRYATYPKEDS